MGTVKTVTNGEWTITGEGTACIRVEKKWGGSGVVIE